MTLGDFYRSSEKIKGKSNLHGIVKCNVEFHVWQWETKMHLIHNPLVLINIFISLKWNLLTSVTPTEKSMDVSSFVT
jgi:hypothetical protein